MTKTREITRISEYSPEEGDTITTETITAFDSTFEERRQSVTNPLKENLSYGFMGSFKEYKGGDIVDGPRRLQWFDYVCLGQYNANWNTKIDAVAWIATKQTRQKISEHFWDWIFDDERSPYRDLLKHVVRIKNPVSNYTEGMIWVKVDSVPHKLFASFMIALKAVTAQHMDIAWLRWVQAGLDPALALALTASNHITIRTDKSKKEFSRIAFIFPGGRDPSFFSESQLDADSWYWLKRTHPYSGSTTFGDRQSQWGRFNPKAFMKGEYVLREKPDISTLPKGSSPQPCNQIWLSAPNVIWSHSVEVDPLKTDPWGLYETARGTPNKELMAEINKRSEMNTPIDWSKSE